MYLREPFIPVSTLLPGTAGWTSDDRKTGRQKDMFVCLCKCMSGSVSASLCV